MIMKEWISKLSDLDYSFTQLSNTQNKINASSKIQLDHINATSDQFKNAMEIQCRAHLTQLRLLIQEWEKKHQ